MASESPPGGPPGAGIVIAGAGSVGCFVGGLLASGGRDVTLLARPRTCDTIRAHGLTLSDFSGLSLRVLAGALRLATDPACLGAADLVLVTVKTGDSADMADLIAAHASATAPVISLQNGLHAITILRRHLPGREVRAGMVPFNVVPRGLGGFHRATSGDIEIGRGATALAEVLSVPGLTVTETANITAVQWGKLLLNLNNAPNALSGQTIHAMLLDPTWRRLMADQMAEALRVLSAAGIAATPPAPVPAGWMPSILRLPTFAFRRIAGRMLTVDPSARMSMSHDLAAGRPTEIAALQGAIVDLGAAHGVATPICAHIMALIRRAESVGTGGPHLLAADLYPS